MYERKRPKEDLVPAKLEVKVPLYMINELSLMEKTTRLSVDALVEKALGMFIATHNDFLGRTPNSK